MISVHFNGEIVRHPDPDIIQKFVRHKNHDEGRCPYGLCKYKCSTYQYYVRQEPDCFAVSELKQCPFYKTDKCPGRAKRKKTGAMDKTFTMDWKTYRKCASAAHWMIKESKTKTIFFTLTFPRFKGNHKLTKSFYYDEITNKLFSRFAENLRANYSCSGYIACKEYGETNHRVHFHVLCSIPYTPFARLNRYWCDVISKYCYNYSNALQTDKKCSSVIKNPDRAVRYVCKYFNKCFGQRSRTRVIFISNAILKAPVHIREESHDTLDYIKRFKSVEFKKYDHVTVFKIRGDADYRRFCNEFLYPLFECSVNCLRFYVQKTHSPPVYLN